MQFITEETFEAFSFYGFLDHGLLPQNGALMDQGNKFIEQMRTIRSAYYKELKEKRGKQS